MSIRADTVRELNALGYAPRVYDINDDRMTIRIGEREVELSGRALAGVETFEWETHGVTVYRIADVERILKQQKEPSKWPMTPETLA